MLKKQWHKDIVDIGLHNVKRAVTLDKSNVTAFSYFGFVGKIGNFKKRE